MKKFTKITGTEIRRYKEVETNKIIAIIGEVKELVEKEIIYRDNTKGNENKWLVLFNGGENIVEFDNIESAKEYCKNNL